MTPGGSVEGTHHVRAYSSQNFPNFFGVGR